MVNWKFWGNSNNNGNNESSPLLQQQQPQQQDEDIIASVSSQQPNLVPLSVSSTSVRNRQPTSYIQQDSNGMPISQSMDSIINTNTSNNQGPLIEETPLTFSSFLTKLNKKNLSQSGIHNHHHNNHNNNNNNEDESNIPSSSSSTTSNNNNQNNHNNNNQNNDDDKYKRKKKTINEKLKIVKKRIPYYIPILSWLPKYQKSNLAGDITAGITTAIMLVPQSLAYALLVGLPPIYGLYTGLMPLLVYVVFGTSRQLSIGPEALISLIVGTTLREISNDQEVALTTDEMIACANILAFLVGVFSMILGLLRFGFLSEVLSRPLIRGFINAVAITILLDQLDTLLGIPGISGESGWRKIPSIFKHWSNVNQLSLIISIIAIVMLLIMAQIKKRFCPEKRTSIIHHIIFFIPSILVVVVVGISVSAGLDLKGKGIVVLGYYSTSFPVPTLPKLNRWDMVNQLIGPALFISIVGFVESMAVSKNFATKHNYQVSTNRELVAIGASNIFGSIFLSYPAYGSMTRSAVNDRAGAKTQLSGLFTFLIVLLTLLLLMPIFQYLPRVIMSSIIFVAALGLLEVHDILFLWKLRAWIDLLLFSATFICTFVFSVEVGLVVSIGASILLVIRQSSAPHFTVLGRLSDQPNKYKDIIQFPDAQQVDGVLIIRFEESIYFANIGQVKEILFRIENMGNAMAHPSEALPVDQRSVLHGIVFDMRNVPIIDASSTHILYETVQQYKQRNISVCFVKLRDSHKKTFIRAGFMDLIDTDLFFSSTNDAVLKIQQSIINNNNQNNNDNNNGYSFNNSMKNSFSYSSYIYNNNDNSNNNSPLSVSQHYNSILDNSYSIGGNNNNSNNNTGNDNIVIENINNNNNENNHDYQI